MTADPFRVEVMMTPTAGTIICLTQKFLHDDVDVDIDTWSLCAESVRMMVVIVNREDGHGVRVLSCWYYGGNMKYVSMRIGPCFSCLSLTSFALVTQLPISVFKLPLQFGR